MQVTDSELPFISIVTPALNCARYIGEAVENVLNQEYPRFEHIIMDGGSTDGTLDMLNGYPHLRVISEPDRGLYDALNKGIRLAQGDYIGWLNADDLYADGVFHDLGHKAREMPTVELFTGDSDLFEDTPNGRRVLRTNRFYTCQELAQGQLSGVVSLNGCFFGRELFENVGAFTTAYELVSDHEFLFRLSIYGPRCASLARVSYHYRQHEQSLTWGRKRADNTVSANEHLMAIACQYRSMADAPAPLRSYSSRLYRNSAINLIKHQATKGCFTEGVAILRAAHKQDRRFMRSLLGRALTRGPIWLSRLALDKVRPATRSRGGR